MVAFRGGERLAIALAKLAENLSKPATLRVGFLEGSTSSDGESIPLRAALNEFGHEHNGVVVPPRPFFRQMIAAKSDEWPEKLGNLLKANDYDAEKALNLAGTAIASELQQSIKDTTSPPLAQSTIDRKGHSQPLIETGDMIRAVDFEVKS